MTPLKTHILLADDHALVRQGLRLMLDAEPDLEVVAETGNGADAIGLALHTEIDFDDCHIHREMFRDRDRDLR
jgi:DNA-binding NarL/FixJ family response regulator